MLSHHPSIRSVAFSAFRAGSLSILQLRPSRRSFTGFVLVCFFRKPAAASAFARRWASRLGCSVAVRGRGFVVSIPVGYTPTPNPFIVCSGGLRGLVQSLARMGA